MQEGNPYASPASEVEPAPEAGLQLGGRFERLLANIVDSLINIAAFAALALPFALVSDKWKDSIWMTLRGLPPSQLWEVALSAIGFVVFLLVQGYPLADTGQTWGKRLLKLRIVDMSGRKPEFWSMVGLRYGSGWLISLLPLVGAFYGLVDVLFIFRADKRCLHDLIAGTRVVVAKPPANLTA